MLYQRVVLNQFGGPEQLELQTVDSMIEPAKDEVRVRVLVTSAAFTDVMIRKGMYPDVKEKPPFVPGYDLVGIVENPAGAVFVDHLHPYHLAFGHVPLLFHSGQGISTMSAVPVQVAP